MPPSVMRTMEAGLSNPHRPPEAPSARGQCTASKKSASGQQEVSKGSARSQQVVSTRSARSQRVTSRRSARKPVSPRSGQHAIGTRAARCGEGTAPRTLPRGTSPRPGQHAASTPPAPGQHGAAHTAPRYTRTEELGKRVGIVDGPEQAFTRLRGYKVPRLRDRCSANHTWPSIRLCALARTYDAAHPHAHTPMRHTPVRHTPVRHTPMRALGERR